MPETCTMMFEVNDLKVASPATVSRCGMVYLEPEHLGWKVVVESWAERMQDQIIEPYLTQLKTCLIPMISSCLNFIHIFLNKERI